MKKAKTNKFILEAHSFSSSPRLSPFLCLALECEANTRATNNTKRVHKFSCERTHRDSSSCVFDKSFFFFLLVFGSRLPRKLQEVHHAVDGEKYVKNVCNLAKARTSCGGECVVGGGKINSQKKILRLSL